MEKGVVPKRGEVVTFTYESMKFGVPFNPVIYRSRSDILWEDVVRDVNEDKSPEGKSIKAKL